MPVHSDGTGALVLEIQRMSTEDGPGLRTTLFLKGCSLSCRWCHNPESISACPQIRWIDSRCIGCGDCLGSCPVSALSLEGGSIMINRSLCTGCGTCEEVCPSSALEIWGRLMTAEEVCRELVKDRAYFGDSGGITVSGGEAALQAGFVSELFHLLRTEGIHTALDTCGVCTPAQLETSCRNADLILFDLKESDPELHRLYTGGSLKTVQGSFTQVIAMLKKSRLHEQAWPGDRPKRLWIRTPIIPGLTDREDNIRTLARFILEKGEGLWDRWELCAFNNLCLDKYQRLGREWDLAGASLMSREAMDGLIRAAILEGIDEKQVSWTGSVIMEE